MTSFLRHQVYPAVALLVALTVVTGVIYPAVVTAVAQIAFPSQANGSMIVVDGKAVGSSLIGQYFNEPRYFWGRPSAAVSAADPNGYDASNSGGSNLGPTNATLIEHVVQRVDALRKANGGGPVPVDLVTSSASGLDPDISPQAAAYQVDRVAKARGMSVAAVTAAVARFTQQPILGFLGEPSVNVLELNLYLDGLIR
ncbi:MAG: potassium-transporting ATPase subunit KdpC [Chloroflexi bacterium]|nr:potassium-transporting ATPase subunit KdpC [Chloroflexota bacterium]